MHFPFLCAAAAAAFLPSSDAWAFRRTKRAAWVPSDPKAFEVNLGFDNAGRYIAPIGMVCLTILLTTPPLTALCLASSSLIRASLGPALAISALFCPHPLHTLLLLRRIVRPVLHK